jgi:hypothetical protein
MKNILKSVLIMWLSIMILQAQDRADFLISTGVSIPTGPTISEIKSSPYTPGFKIDGRGLFPLGNLPLSLHGQFGLNMSPLQGANAGGTALNLISLQAGPAYTLQLGDSLQVIAALQGGGFLGMIEGAVGGNGVVSARTDVNLAISSNLTLGLGADYSYYLSTPTPTMDHTWSGLGAGINLKFALNGGRERAGWKFRISLFSRSILFSTVITTIINWERSPLRIPNRQISRTLPFLSIYPNICQGPRLFSPDRG